MGNGVIIKRRKRIINPLGVQKHQRKVKPFGSIQGQRNPLEAKYTIMEDGSPGWLFTDLTRLGCPSFSWPLDSAENAEKLASFFIKNAYAKTPNRTITLCSDVEFSKKEKKDNNGIV